MDIVRNPTLPTSVESFKKYDSTVLLDEIRLNSAGGSLETIIYNIVVALLPLRNKEVLPDALGALLNVFCFSLLHHYQNPNLPELNIFQVLLNLFQALAKVISFYGFLAFGFLHTFRLLKLKSFGVLKWKFITIIGYSAIPLCLGLLLEKIPLARTLLRSTSALSATQGLWVETRNLILAVFLGYLIWSFDVNLFYLLLNS
jgi:hypothetical protein